MSFYKNTIKAMSGFGRIASEQSGSKAIHDLFPSYPTDHRNKGQISVAKTPLNKADYFTSTELSAAAADSLKQLEQFV